MEQCYFSKRNMKGMKIYERFLIVYSSKTGNTEKVAKKFYEVAGERCDLAAVKQVPAVDDYKVIFAGYWVDKGEPDKDMQEFLQTLDNKKVVLFKRWEQKLTLSTGSAH